jgi:PBP1b-binding outer membrane lipoprotein LpoB
MRALHLSTAVVTTLLLAGCSRQTATQTTAAPTPARSVSIDAADAAPPPPPAATAAAPVETSENEPTGQISLEQLNKAMKEYIVISPTPPDDLAELYRAKLIPKIPIPPPGKVYVVDKKKAQVALVNQ